MLRLLLCPSAPLCLIALSQNGHWELYDANNAFSTWLEEGPFDFPKAFSHVVRVVSQFPFHHCPINGRQYAS